MSSDEAGAIKCDDIQAVVILIRAVRAAQTKASSFRFNTCEPPRKLGLKSCDLGAQPRN
jgi:hypothetical protein